MDARDILSMNRPSGEPAAPESDPLEALQQEREKRISGIAAGIAGFANDLARRAAFFGFIAGAVGGVAAALITNFFLK